MKGIYEKSKSKLVIGLSHSNSDSRMNAPKVLSEMKSEAGETSLVEAFSTEEVPIMYNISKREALDTH